MRIALAITNQYPLQLPTGVIYAPVPIHLGIVSELARRGHEVTVFCSEDTDIEAPLKKESLGLVSVSRLRETNPENNYSGVYATASDNTMFSEMYRQANEGTFDLIFTSDAMKCLPFLPFSKVPTLITLHDPLSNLHYNFLKHFEKYPNHTYVAISQAQREIRPDLRYAATIHHGLDVSSMPFCSEPDDYIIFFGRIIKSKGVLDAIAAAKLAGMKLKIAGPFFTNTPSQEAYVAQVKEAIDGKYVEYLGALQPDDLWPHVAKAKGFINLIDVHESFGMVLLESLATGTPVVARRRGAIPEILVDGKNGFIVETVEEAAAALTKISSIDRPACRTYVQAEFSVKRCVDAYEKIMIDMVASSTKNLPPLNKG